MSNSFFPAVQYQYLPQPDNALSDLAKAAAIKSSQQQTQQSQQAFPIEQQQRQATLTGTQQQNQLTQFNIQDRQGIAQALRDSYAQPSSSTASPQPSSASISPSISAPTAGAAATSAAQSPAPTAPAQSSDPTERLAALVARIQDPKYGISPQGQMALIQKFTELGQAVQTMDKTTTDNMEAAHKIVSQAYNSALDAAPEDQAAQWTLERNQMLRSSSGAVRQAASGLPAQYPGQPAPGGSPEAQAALHSLMAEQDIVAAAKKPGEAAEAQQQVRNAAPATQQQMSDVASTISTYAAIPPSMRTGLLTELKNAPDYAAVQKIEARADAAQESFQRSADARQNALAMKDVAVGQVIAGQLVKQDQTLAADLNSTNGIRSLLDMTKGGNQMASAAALTRFAEHEITEGGIKRFNETELNAMGKDAGSWGREFQTWIDKGQKGTPPPATTSDIQAILGVEDQQAHDLHDQNIGFIQQRYAPLAGGRAKGVLNPSTSSGSTPKQVGNVPSSVRQLLANIAPGIHKLSDGSQWLKDADGNISPYEGKQ